MQNTNLGTLSGSDVEAILAAIPLVFAPEFETSDTQTERNMLYAESLVRKLIAREASLTPNESKILCLAVIFAQRHLSGVMHLTLEPETQAAISKHFFSYNKLAPACQEAIDLFDQQHDSV